jgi:hypothetical protein
MVSAAPITDLFNTGASTTTPGTGGIGSQDDNWDYVAGATTCPNNAATCGAIGSVIATQDAWVPFDEATVSPVGFGVGEGGHVPGYEFWNTNTSLGESHWISPAVRNDGNVDTDGTGSVMDFGVSVNEFRTSFTLPAFTSALIEGYWWADGTLTDDDCGISLNGNCIASTQTVPEAFAGVNGNADGEGTFFSISSGFVTGANTLSFFVDNANWETGLRVTFTEGSYDNFIPEPSTYLLMGGGLAALALRRRRKKA